MKDQRGEKGDLNLLKGVVGRRTPFEECCLEELGKGSGEQAKIPNEPVVELCEAVEAPHLRWRCWSRPVPDSCGLAWIDGDARGGNDEPEECNRMAQKRALTQVGKELLGLKLGANLL